MLDTGEGKNGAIMDGMTVKTNQITECFDAISYHHFFLTLRKSGFFNFFYKNLKMCAIIAP